MKKRIAFLGGGHSNTLGIRQLMQKLNKVNKMNNYEFFLISDYDKSAYSGMIPGSIAGYYTKEESFIDLIKFSKLHNCNFIQQEVIKILPEENKLYFRNNDEFHYDILSIDVGSKTYGGNEIKGVAEFAIETRPINKLLEKIESFEKNKIDGNSNINIGVVGSGVAGIELAFSLQYRFESLYGKCSNISIFSSEECIIPGYEKNVVFELIELANEKGIDIIQNSRALKVLSDGVLYQYKNNSSEIHVKNFDLVIWAAGARPQEINYKSNLDLDKRGYILVDDNLNTLRYKNIFASGDCIQLDKFKDLAYPFPAKAGVYAVRQGPIIADNIFKLITSSNDDEQLEFTVYNPQLNFLSLITLGNRKAFGTKWGISFYGKWVWNLKEHIDTEFVKMFSNEIDFVQSKQKDNSIDESYFTADKCIEKLKYSDGDEDFSVQLKILEKLVYDEQLLNEVKNKLNLNN